MIQIDPDDIELKEAIVAAISAIDTYNEANKAFNRFEPSMYLYGAQFTKMLEARNEMEFRLALLGKLVLERL